MTSTTEAISGYKALYAPTSAAQAQTLPDVAEGLRTQLFNLCLDPTAARAEEVAANLAGAQRAVLRLREALLREQEVPDGVTI